MRYSHRRSLHVGLAATVLGGLLTSVPPFIAAAEPPAQGRQRVIVELSGAGALEAAPGTARNARASDVKAQRRKLADNQDVFLAAVKDSGVAASSVHKLSLLVNAVAMTVGVGDMAKLKRLPGVKAVSIDGTMRAMDTDANDVVGNPRVWEREDPAGAKVTGKGVTVAVIDTGVDYDHPDLGGGFGEGHKVVGGYDFANGDADPMDDMGHGTHVAGIVAGKAAEADGVTGAAPDARLLAYKVLGADGSGHGSDIIAALEASVDPDNPHRADIINLSLGDPYGTATDPVARAASAAADSGALVFASAGNTGPGYWTVGSPAAAPGVIAVGASTSGIRLPVVKVAGQDEPVPAYRGARSANPPARPVTTDIADIGMGTPQDWERAGDVTGKIVLYAAAPSADAQQVWPADLAVWREAEKRGALALIGGASADGGAQAARGERSHPNPLTEQAAARPGAPAGHGAAQPARGEALVPLENDFRPTDSGDSLRMGKLVVIGVEPAQGKELAALAATGAQLALSGRDSTDEMAAFSSRGPDGERLGLKPEIVAPGVEIRSTVPKGINAEGVEHKSGTSMASPLAAGSAALLRQLHPDRDASELGAALIGTATTLDGPDIQTQGNGRIDTAAAADTDLYASPATVSFGLPDMDQPKVTGTQDITVHNSGSKPVRGTVTVDGPATVTPDRVGIPAGGTATVRLDVERDRPDVTDPATNHLSGRVTVTPDEGRRISVPYLMMAIPLYVNAAIDPSIDGDTTIYIYSPTPLKAPPALTVTPPRGKAFTTATRLTADPQYYRADLKGLDDGVHRMAARATTSTGQRQYGTGAFEVTLVPSKSKRWKPVGPNSAAGTTHLVPGAPRQAVMTQGTRSGGWLTTDSGKTWHQLNNTPVSNLHREPSLVIDAKNPKRWWEAVSSAHPSAYPGGGALLRTEDSGRTWDRLNAPPLPWEKLTADPRSRVLLATTVSYDRYASRDGGDNWAPVDLASFGVTGDAYDARFGGDDLYVWAGQIIWVIRDFATGHGTHAERVFEGKVRETHLGGYDVDGDLVAVKAMGKKGGLWVSRDGGRTVEKTSRSESGMIDVRGGDIYHDDLTGNGAISRDGGRTWTTVKQPAPGYIFTDYDRWADGSYTIGSSAGLFRSTDGGDYRRIGVQGDSVPALAAVGDSVLAGTEGGTFRTQLPAANPEWGQAENDGYTSTAAFHVSVEEPNTVWRLTNDQRGVQKSTDAGMTWEDIGLPGGGATAFMVDPRDSDRIAVSYKGFGSSGLYTTTDGGTHWKTQNHGRYYNTITADPNKPGRMWLGSWWGLAYSDDMGVTRSHVSESEVHAIEFRERTMITGGTAIRVSTDGGKTFAKADAGDLRFMISDIVDVDGTLYAGTTTRWVDFAPNGGRGVLRSTDGGLTWKNISRGMPNMDVLSMAASPDGKYLFAGVDQGGVYRLELDD